MFRPMLPASSLAALFLLPQAPSRVATPVTTLELGGQCPSRIRDQATGGCLFATSVPTPGMLFPPPHDGGWDNDQAGTTSFIGGGQANTADGPLSVIGGGLFNRADHSFSVVGGGVANWASAYAAAIGGGEGNIASEEAATIAGGDFNSASELYATVGGGAGNLSSGISATVPGGSANEATGDLSFAAGFRTRAVHRGAFVWGDSEFDEKFSTAEDQFNVFASGGVRFLIDLVPALVIDQDGRVGIGTSTPSGTLEVHRSSGDIVFSGLGDNGEGAVTLGAPNGETGVSGISKGSGERSHILWTDEGLVLDADAVHVRGMLSKGGGSFTIDHPLDPRNKTLSHSFVESPDMMNVYNGNAILDERGEASIELPDWFEALNRDFRYQLTAVGGPGPNLHVAEKIAGNRFRIGGGSSGLEVSWQVTGIRRDAFADAHRIQVEQEKPAAQRGAYLHPEAYGAVEKLHSGR